MRRELDQTSVAQKTCLLGYTSDAGGLLGFIQMSWLEWDTHHFGFESWRLDHLGVWGSSSKSAIAEALVQRAIETVCAQGCQYIQARMPLDNLPVIHALESTGFRTVEVSTTWMFDLTQSPIPPKRHPDMIRDFQLDDTEALIELARAVYTPTPDRFHMDPHLSSKASDELYAEWMRNSCSGQLADHIAVAESDGKAVGYATLRHYGDHDGFCNVRIAQLGLGGMLPDFRNRGIVTDLVIHNLEWLDRRQADFCFVGTQGNNIPPQRVWLKIGFKPATMAITLHYWANVHERCLSSNG